MLKFFWHFFSGNANQSSLKLESARGFKSNVDFHLAFSIDDTFLIIKFEALIQNLLNLLRLLLTVCFVDCLHHQLDVKVAVRLVRNNNTQGLSKADCDGAEV